MNTKTSQKNGCTVSEKTKRLRLIRSRMALHRVVDKELAAELNVSQDWVTRVLNEKASYITIENIRKFERALKLLIDGKKKSQVFV